MKVTVAEQAVHVLVLVLVLSRSFSFLPPGQNAAVQ